MKRILILIISVFVIVGCTPKTTGVVTCEKEFADNLKIKRSISLSHSNNLITSIETIDRIYFDDNFTLESVSKLEKELEDKFSESKNLKYEILKESDSIIITSTLNNLKNAQSNEFSFVGMEIDAKDQPIGLKETILLNEAAGFTCSEVE